MTNKAKNELSIKDMMMNGDVELIEKHISADNNLGCILAIKATIKNKIKTDVVIKSLKKLKNKDEFEFCVNISELALAALHILELEYYLGDNRNVRELICNKDSIINDIDLC